jgi:ABC-type polysaccharide/polyol phosphate transport system ATPase subunit
VSTAVSVEHVSKRFRLYQERNQTLKAAVTSGRRARYDELWALRDVDLTIPTGSTFGLLGENGSGKSTLLKCMARILRPDEGQIRSRGKMAALLELGAGFHPELSGRENVYLNGSILGLSGRDLDRRFDDIVGFAGLERFIDSPVKNYSSGMYVRLGFSVAINVEPDILLIDEVLAVGDESFQRRCNEKIADLKGSGRTIIIVSHALGAMRDLCDQIAWLDQGTVQKVGAAGAVVDEYLGSAHKDRVEEPGAGTRWGSGQARITTVEMLDACGARRTSFRTGDDITVRLHFDAPEPILNPVFGVAVFSLSGAHVTGPNTRDAGVDIPVLHGKGWVDLSFPRAPLLQGTYDLSASLYDSAILSPYDFRHLAVRFDVEPGHPRELHGGVVSLNGRWSLSRDGSAPAAARTQPRAAP